MVVVLLVCAVRLEERGLAGSVSPELHSSRKRMIELTSMDFSSVTARTRSSVAGASVSREEDRQQKKVRDAKQKTRCCASR
jgi:hypothetical protein